MSAPSVVDLTGTPGANAETDSDDGAVVDAALASPRVLLPSRAVPEDVLRPTRAEVSLGRLRWNLQALRRHTRAKIWCVLKADGYGHGAKACARTLERAGADGLCVALIEEAIELREAGVTLPILVMSGYFGGARAELLHYQLTPVVHSPGQVEALEEEAAFHQVAHVPFHLKVDTGMGRLGISQRDLPDVIQAVRKCRHLTFDGLMTHFASADTDIDSVHEQLRRFAVATDTLKQAGLSPRVRHAANSAALLRCEDTHFDLVRPGIALFGVQPCAGSAPELRPAMRLLSTLISLREFEPGQTVGYGGSFTAQRRSRIATLPIGYADGLGRQHSNRGHVLVRGRRAPIVGRVSMDLVTVDVTDLPGASVGDEAVILGEQQGPLGKDAIRAEEIAVIEGTIPWEVLTSVSRRVPRFYRDA